MKTRPLATGLLTTVVLSGCAMTPDRVDDKTTIEQVLESWNTGWRTKNAELATTGYSDDADFTNAFGFYRVGHAAIEEYISHVFTLDFVMAGASEDESVTIRFLHDDIALVRTLRTRTGQLMPDGSEMKPREITHLRVFQRIDGRWQIVSHLISDANETQLPGD